MTAPGRARRFATEQLSGVLGGQAGAASVIDRAELVISELVTNAVNASSETDLTLDLHHDVLRITVDDNGIGRPVPVDAGDHDEHGRGLRIVAALTQTWGVRRLPTGNRVWAEVAIPAGLTVGLGCSLTGREPSTLG